MSRRLCKTIFVAMAFLGLVTTAWAYWTTQGSGSASAEVATLSAPTNVSANASPGSSTVSVSWTGSTLSNGTPAQGYYVTRTNTSTSNTSAACGSSASSLVNGASCSDTSVPDGTYTYKVTAVYQSWTAASAASNQVTVLGDNTPPTVQSINRQASSPTNSSSVQFAITFSESVSGVDLTDFALATTGVTGASKTSISGSGASYTVTVNTGSGDGTVGLNLVDNDSITDGASNKLGGTGTSGAGDGSFTGQVYTIDKTAPTVQSMNRSASSPTNATSVQFAVTFTESVSGADLNDFALATTGVTGASKTSISGSGASYTVTVNTGSGDGTVGLNLVDDDSIQDGLGQKLGGTGTGNGNFTGQVYTIDRTLPTRTALEFFDANGNGKVDQVKVTYNEALGSYTAGNSPWTLANVPSGGTLASVGVAGSVVTLSLTEGAGAASTSAGSFTVAYTAPGSGGTVDAAGNSAASFAATAPTDKAAPALTLLEMFDTNSPTPRNGKVDQVVATFSETLASSTATAPWTLTNVPSGGTLASVSTSGSVATLTITEGASAADTSVGSFTVALATSAAGIRDSASNQSSFTTQAPGDKAGPVPVSIVDSNINLDGKFELNDTMTVTFSESVTGVAASSSVSLVGGNGGNNDTVSMSNLLLGTPSLGRSDYISGNGATANFNSSALSQPVASQVKVTLATCTGTCANLTQAAGTGSFIFTPVTTITDAAANPAAGSITVSIRLF